MADAAAPLTPADCDLQDFKFMPVDVDRVLNSDTWQLANDAEKVAAITLWFKSWRQVPAASLPDNDRILANLSGAKTWSRVREQAMRGWHLCSDGRYYHTVVAEKALEAWIEKLLSAAAGGVTNAKRWQAQFDRPGMLAKLQEAVGMLQRLAPTSKTLKKPAVMKALNGVLPGESPPDPPKVSPPDRKTSPPDKETRSPPDSPPVSPPRRNRQGHRQGQGLDTEDSPDGLVGRADLPPCPFDRIVQAYHELLPELPRVRLLGEDRRKAVRELWRFALTEPKSDGSPRATNADEAFTWILGYFTRARDNDWLMGRTPRVNGHENWQCDLDFLASKKGRKHVIEKTREQRH